MQRLRRWSIWVPAVIAGSIIAAIFAAPLLVAIPPIDALQLSALDLLFYREGGPRLGAQPPDPAIVLVFWDGPSSEALGGVAVSPVHDDLALYRALFDQGARVVADTRLVAATTPRVGRLLDGMATIDQSGRLLRDVWPDGATWFAANTGRYVPEIGHDLFTDSSVDTEQYLRFYPMFTFELHEGFQEGLALKVARATLGQPPQSSIAIDRAIEQSGIAAPWAIQAGFPKDKITPAARLAAASPRPYALAADRQIPWVLRRSRLSPASVSPAVFWINEGAPPGSFPAYSYIEALSKRLPAGAVRGKIVLIGFSANTGVDLFPVPSSSSRRSTKAEVVAQAVQTLLDGRFLQPIPRLPALLQIVVLSLVGALSVALLRPWPSGAVIVGALLLFLALAVALFHAGFVPDLTLAPGGLLTAGAAVGAGRYLHEERTRRRIYDLFGRYVARAVVAELVRRPANQALDLRGVNREVTVLFADIRGFTSFSEHLPPEEVLQRLNALFRVMVQCVFQQEGTVDKYIGDAIMVLFNAPLDQADHVLRAVRTALAMQQAVARLDGRLAFGIGIHVGDAVVGNVGTEERLEYTAIGNSVNLAARLCDNAARGEVVISEAVYARVHDAVPTSARPPIRVKGIDRELTTYRLLPADAGGSDRASAG